MTAIHGSDDDRVTEGEIAAWAEVAGEQFRHLTVPGDHFFLDAKQSEARLLRLIVDTLERAIAM